MSKLADLTRAPIPVVLAGTEYYLSPLGPLERGELERWAEDYPLERARRITQTMGEEAPDDLKREVWQAAIEESTKGMLFSEALLTGEGVIRML